MKTITLSDADLNLIAHALGAMPYAQVAPLISDIQTQLVAQTSGFNTEPNGTLSSGT